MECERFKLYEVVCGLYCSSFESLKTNMSPEKGPLEFRITPTGGRVVDEKDGCINFKVARCCGKSWGIQGDAEEHNV